MPIEMGMKSRKREQCGLVFNGSKLRKAARNTDTGLKCLNVNASSAVNKDGELHKLNVKYLQP